MANFIDSTGKFVPTFARDLERDGLPTYDAYRQYVVCQAAVDVPLFSEMALKAAQKALEAHQIEHFGQCFFITPEARSRVQHAIRVTLAAGDAERGIRAAQAWRSGNNFYDSLPARERVEMLWSAEVIWDAARKYDAGERVDYAAGVIGTGWLDPKFDPARNAKKALVVLQPGETLVRDGIKIENYTTEPMTVHPPIKANFVEAQMQALQAEWKPDPAPQGNCENDYMDSGKDLRFSDDVCDDGIRGQHQQWLKKQPAPNVTLIDRPWKRDRQAFDTVFDTIGVSPEEKAARAKKAAEPKHDWNPQNLRCNHCGMMQFKFIHRAQPRCLTADELAVHRAMKASRWMNTALYERPLQLGRPQDA